MTLFISYSNKDEALVREMVRDLAAARFTVWLDQELRGGDPWWQDILHQIRECDVFVFALSNNSLSSKPCRAELNYARQLGVPVLPVQIGPVDNLRATPVADIQVVDYRERTAVSGIALVAAVTDGARERRPLPDPLPPPPPVPFEYLLRLGVALEANALTPAEQSDLLRQLRDCLETEDDEGVLEDARGLLRALRRRPDATHRSVVEIDSLLAENRERVQVPATGGRPAANGGTGAGSGSGSGSGGGPGSTATREAPTGGPPPRPRPPVEGTGRPAPTVPPGWYPDPGGSASSRYWDGARWTEHTRGPADPPRPPVPVPRPPGGGGQPAPAQQARGGFSIAAFVLGGIAVLLLPVVLGLIAIGCAITAKVKNERLAWPALGVAIGGTILGVILDAVVNAAYLY